MELDVLRGAVNLIRKYRPVLYVENDREEHRQGIFDWIASEGYECWQHFPPLFCEDNYLENKETYLASRSSANVFAFHKESHWKKFDSQDFELHSPELKVKIIH